jgi:RNA-directed DNA polymerase
MNPKTLLERLHHFDHLYLAWKNLNRSNPESFGLSGESIAQFEANLDTNLRHLSEQIKTGKFNFSPTRPYLIRKDNGKFRPLQISEVGDRVVLKGIALILEEHLQNLLLPGEGISFAYQKRKGIQDALSKIKEHYDNGNPIVYEADIIDFFGTVSRGDLVRKICEHLPDGSLNGLITGGITPKVGSLQSIQEEQRHLFVDKGGIPQGNPLSPLFSNVYLSPFDLMMRDKGYSLVRYADDFVVLAPSVEVAKQAYEVSRAYLRETLGVDVHELSEEQNSKTRIVDPTKATFSFLSVTFDGKQLFPSLKNKDRFIKDLLSLGSETKDLNIHRMLSKLKNKHDGWISTFLFTNVQRYFEEIDWVINWGIYKYFATCGLKLQQSTLGKVPTSYRKQGDTYYPSGDCISMEQRRNTGIPLSKTLYDVRMEARQKATKANKPLSNRPAKAVAV